MPCSDGLKDVYCLSCEDGGDYYSRDASACHSCADVGNAGWVVVLLALGVVVLLALLISVGYRCCARRGQYYTSHSGAPVTFEPLLASQTSIQHTSLAHGLSSAPRLRRSSRGGLCSALMARASASRWGVLAAAFWGATTQLVPVVQPAIKIGWSFYQITTLVPTIYDVTLPDSIRTLLAAITGAVQVNFDGLATPLQCWGLGGYRPKLVVAMVGPLVLMALAPLLGLWLALGESTAERPRGWLLTRTLYRTLYWEQVMSFLTFPLVSSVAFAAFECEDFDDGRSLLKADYHVECHTSAWAPIAALAVAAIVVHVFAIPLVFLALLLRARAAIHDGKPTPLSRAMSFLHAPFTEHASWWEFVETAKKLLLVGFARVLFEAGSVNRLFVAMLIALLSLTFLTLRRPYRALRMNYLAIVTTFLLACYLLLCLGYKLGELSDEGALSHEVAQQFSFGSVLMTFILGAVVLGGAFLFVGLCVHELRERRRRHALLSDSDLETLHRVSNAAAADATQHADLVERLTRFFSGEPLVDLNALTTADAEDAARGISHFLCVPDPIETGLGGSGQIVAEVRALVSMVEALPDNEVIKRYRDPWEPADIKASAIRARVREEVQGNLDYVMNQRASEKTFHNGVRDKGRGPVTLSYFVNHADAVAAELSEAHVISQRLYTTHAFKYLNGPLRDLKRYHDGEPHPLPVTVAYISDGIKKLRAQSVKKLRVQQQASTATAVPTSLPALWRGMKDRRVGDEFMEGLGGGTELGVMSTTTKLAVAARYGMGHDVLLVKIKVNNVLHHGADLEFLTAFPGEAEVCFPPLTHLEPTGRTQDVRIGEHRFHVVEVVPSLA